MASLDGNGWATRFAPLLASSSVVFKQTSPWFEFFYIAVRTSQCMRRKDDTRRAIEGP